jgi:hypothetical protein
MVCVRAGFLFFILAFFIPANPHLVIPAEAGIHLLLFCF